MILFSLALLVLVADQLTKLVIRSIPEGQILFELGLFRIVHLRNSGAAFGIFPGQSFPLMIVAMVGVALLLVYIFFVRYRYPFLYNTWGMVALGLMFGGTLGNLADRIWQNGSVTDFIDFTYWPTFNVADSAITVGALLFAWILLRAAQAEKQ